MSEIRKYRKTAVVEAMRFVKSRKHKAGTNLFDIVGYIGSEKCIVRPPGAVGIKTLEGVMWAEPGYYICKGEDGECWPVRGDIFERTYKEIADPTKGELWGLALRDPE